jgi:hypothetical protein
MAEPLKRFGSIELFRLKLTQEEVR